MSGSPPSFLTPGDDADSPPAAIVRDHDDLVAIAIANRPRIWTVWAALATAFLVLIVSQIAGGIGLVAWHFFAGGTKANLATGVIKLATSPEGLMFVNGLAQLGIASVAVGAACFSPQPLAQRLGLVRPSLPLWTMAVLILGAIIPLLIGVGSAVWLAQYIQPDQSIKLLYEQMTAGNAIPFILYIALAPGFSEELFFRGYMQRRFLERWNPWTALMVTSVIFGLFHVMPHAILAAFPLGIWLGILAWRTGSIWPGIACHAAVNGAWNVRNVGMALGYFPKTVSTPVLVIVAAIGLVAFVWSLVLMFGPRQAATSTRASHEPPAL